MKGANVLTVTTKRMQSRWALLCGARTVVARWALGWCLLSLVGCAGIDTRHTAASSQAFDQPQRTTLGQAHAQGEQQHAAQSGFRFLNNGVSALLSRAALIDAAEQAIDVQSYIFEADDTGLFLLERLLAAADRGVRVRLLLDDHHIGFDDATLARINAHRHVEVRLFNPYPDRLWPRSLQLLGRMDRLGRRMHNKLFLVDAQVGVIGGRNIGNHYFEGEGESNFRDADLLATGLVVRQAAASFDQYWNSPMVVPVEALGVRAEIGSAAVSEAALAQWRVSASGYGPHAEYQRRREEFQQRLVSAQGWVWAPAQLVAEPPVRQAEGAPKSSAEVARALARVRDQARQEVVYATAYFVPGERGVAVLTQLAARGVQVRVLTNSLAATDVVAVHAGYAPYRQALLAGGVALYEYRPDAPRPSPLVHRVRAGHSESSLHAKVAVFDRHTLWVGSANFDPRSRYLNTEVGVLIESATLSEQVLDTLARDLQPNHSWRLALQPDDQGRLRVVWQGERAGQPWQTDREPDASTWRQWQVRWFQLLGIEHLL